MTRVSKFLGATALIAAGLVGSANATPINFTINGAVFGTITTNGTGGNIVTGATTVTLPTAGTLTGPLVSGVSGPSSGVAVSGGATNFASIVFSNYVLPVGNSFGQAVTPFTVTIGSMEFSFSQQVSNNYQFISYNSNTSTTGVLKEDFTGTVLADASLGFIGSTDSLSLQCQDTGGSNTCTVQIFVPSADPVPEPITMSILGAGLAGLVVARRRRAA